MLSVRFSLIWPSVLGHSGLVTPLIRVEVSSLSAFFARLLIAEVRLGSAQPPAQLFATSQAATNPNELVAQCTNMVAFKPRPT